MDGANVLGPQAGTDPYLALFQQYLQQQSAFMQNSVRGQHNATAAAASKVKLPSFWEKDTAAWFDLVEEILAENNIVNARAKYRAVLIHIPQHLVERARGVITPPLPP